MRDHRKIIFGGVVLLVLALTFAGCASNPGPIVPPSGACATSACADSQICKVFGNPVLLFGTADDGLAALIIEVPAAKAPIHNAYSILLTTFQQPNLTWAQVAAGFASVGGEYVGRWGPLVTALAGQITSLVSLGAVNPCDQNFLIQHAQTVLAMTQ